MVGLRPAYPLAGFALLGAFAAVSDPSDLPWFLAALLFLPALVGPRLAPRRGLHLAILLAVAFLSWARSASLLSREAELRASPDFAGRLLVLGEPNARGVARVRLLSADGTRIEISGRYVGDTRLPLRSGDLLEGRLSWRAARFTPTGGIVRDRPRWSWRRLFADARASIGARIDRVYPRAGPFLRAILLGERDRVAGPLSETLRATGTLHLLAVSGLNLAFLVGAGWILLRGLPRAPRDALLLAAVVVYSLLVEGGASVARAAVAAAVFLLGDLVGRPADARNAWGVGALLALLLDPMAVRDAGFVLSFGGVLALLHYPIRARPLLAPFTGALAVESALAPIVAARFGLVAPWAVFANGLLVPVMAIWYPLAGFALVVTPLAPAVERIVLAWLDGIRVLSRLPGATVEALPLPAHLAGLYAVAWLLAPVARIPVLVRAGLLGSLLVAGVVVWDDARTPRGARTMRIEAVPFRDAARIDSGPAGVLYLDRRGWGVADPDTEAEVLVARRLPDERTLERIRPRVAILDEPPRAAPPGLRILSTRQGPVVLHLLPNGRIRFRTTSP